MPLRYFTPRPRNYFQGYRDGEKLRKPKITFTKKFGKKMEEKQIF